MGKKILVVDDAEMNLAITEMVLTKFGLDVDTASLGAEAIELVKNNIYDVILMDYFMPNMDGIETTDRIRKLADLYENDDKEKAEYLRTVKIVALTADDSEETKQQFIDAGISGFMSKPIDINKIMKWL